MAGGILTVSLSFVMQMAAREEAQKEVKRRELDQSAVIHRLAGLLEAAHVVIRECAHCDDVDLPSQFYWCPTDEDWYCKACYHELGLDLIAGGPREREGAAGLQEPAPESTLEAALKVELALETEAAPKPEPAPGDSAGLPRCECKRAEHPEHFVLLGDTWVCARCRGLLTQVCHRCERAYLEDECVECLADPDEWDCPDCEPLCRKEAGVPSPPPEELQAGRLPDSNIVSELMGLLEQARVEVWTCSLCGWPGFPDRFTECHEGSERECCDSCVAMARETGKTLCRVDCSGGRRARALMRWPKGATRAAQEAGPDSDSEAE